MIQARLFKIILPAALLLSSGNLLGEEELKVRVPRPLQAESSMEPLEAWETPISGFFIRSHHGVPNVDDSRWELRVDGLVEHPLALTLADLRKMKAKSLHAVLECAGNGRGLQEPHAGGVQWEKGAVGNAEWTGVPLADILALAAPKPNARFARVEGADRPAMPETPGFIRSVPLEKLRKDDTLVALGMNREPVPVLHGGPLRLVLPGWYGQNWIKWLTHITLTEDEDAGFYMKKAYRMPKTRLKSGEPWDPATGAPIEQLLVQSIIVSPSDGETVQPGDVSVRGKAFSGAGPVAKVELSIDGGQSWLEAELADPHADGGWQEFRAVVSTPGPGPLTIFSRATDSAGGRQPLEQPWNPGGYLHNAADKVTVELGDDYAASGAAVLRSKCQTCHAPEMVHSQRLSPKQWDAVLTKMGSFGVKLAGPERQVLLKHLERFSPERPAELARPLDYEEARSAWLPALPAGDQKRGATLFAKNCARCHGGRAEGGAGPRLAGRHIPAEAFRTMVLAGAREMPPFAKLLKEAELADIQSYLSRTVSLPGSP